MASSQRSKDNDETPAEIHHEIRGHQHIPNYMRRYWPDQSTHGPPHRVRNEVQIFTVYWTTADTGE